MKLVIRVRNEKTKRYRREYHPSEHILFTDSEFLPESITNVPFILDSVIDGSSGIFIINLTPAWNKKKTEGVK